MNFFILRKVLDFYVRFTLSFTAIGYVVRQFFWSGQTPDFTGQTWVVTGGTGGIGRAIVEIAASYGANVIVIARSAEKLAELKKSAPARIATVQADLSLVRDTRRAASVLAELGSRIDVLVNNVGLLLDDVILTKEGKETSYATNLLNHFVLTEDLLAAELFAAAPTIINMASGGMYNAPLDIGYMNVQGPAVYNGPYAYGIHKRGQAALTQYWQEKLGARDFKVYVMHPGWVDTDGVKTALPRFRRVLRAVLRSGAQGADTAIWLAATRPTSPNPDAFWFDRAPRPAHAYQYTRQSRYSVDDLVLFLARERDEISA